ncbi:hypothetical protein [Promicromonospora sp. NFX87]|uniref:hypothetical protein n=1 Tax=Promicromonospora sp. NFX87 TaxID=3402691 RepID=UPI003AFA5050
MTDQTPVSVDAVQVLQIIESAHPDIVTAAVWQVRAQAAEARVAELEAAQAASGTD